jgi:hypothetical protein
MYSLSSTTSHYTSHRSVFLLILEIFIRGNVQETSPQQRLVTGLRGIPYPFHSSALHNGPNYNRWQPCIFRNQPFLLRTLLRITQELFGSNASCIHVSYAETQEQSMVLLKE